MKNILLAVIRFYQKTLSFDHGFLKSFKPFGQCKFYPTCSEYACLAIKKYNLIKAVFLILKRIIHCHPFTLGGVDYP